MTNHRNKQNYRFRTWEFRDRCHLKGGVRQGCFLSLIFDYLIQYIHFHSLYIMSHYYAKFKENPCLGADASTPLEKKKKHFVHSTGDSIDPIFNTPDRQLITIDERRSKLVRNRVFDCHLSPVSNDF